MNDPTDPGAQPSGAVTYVSPEIYFSPEEQDLVASDDAPVSPDPGPAQAPVPPAVPPVDATPAAAPPAEESPTPESLAEEPPIVRHDPFAYMRGAPWMDRRLSPSGRAAYLLRRELEAFPVIEGRDPNHADLDAIVKRTVDYIAPILKREQATDAVYDELEKRRTSGLRKVGFEELKQQRRGYPKPREDLGNGSQKVKELRDNYDSRHPHYHRYEFKDALCQLGTPGCSVEAAYAALQRYAVPGGPNPGVRVENEQDSPVTFKGVPGGHVQTFVEPASLSIVNVTRSDHVFHDGYVQRQVVVEGDMIYLRTFGEGKNRTTEKSMANRTMAKLAFEESTAGIRAALQAPDVPGKGVR